MNFWDFFKALWYRIKYYFMRQEAIAEPEPNRERAVPTDEELVDYPHVVPKEILTDYRSLWEKMFITPGKESTVQWYVNKCIEGKEKYSTIHKLTGVPWELIAILHGMECSFNWKGYLGNGQLIIGTDKKSTWVPKGRGPFATWEAGALDALSHDRYQKYSKWDLPTMLYFSEGYNGWGYRKYRQIKSPYLWGLTNHHSKGKYVSDGRYDPEAETRQAGVAPVLRGLGVKWPRGV